MTGPLEIWGGHECTVSRVGDQWRDQTVLSGHQNRIEDLDLFAGLGLKALRYPVLWERTEVKLGRFDWSWSDVRLQRMSELGLRPVLGLSHHGSGPAWTDLLDPGYAEGLANFAGAAARRYPWVRDWTPVNEPLTTARFSALYGHWYPHRRDEGDFWRALLNQIDAIRLAMRAIRAVNPAARLVQTEDFGRTWGTGPCAGQVRFENDRRLMTWDLLTGRVGRDHVLRAHLDGFGLSERLDVLAADPCPPDLLGVNHYVTSDRFLDHRLTRYPAQAWGGNGEMAYADLEAVRVLDDLPNGWTNCFDTLWDRYRTPIAVTECHLGCSPDEQRRWLAGAWRAATAAREEGVDIEALTVWALLGSHDWDSLLTLDRGNYEPGAFDIRSGSAVETALSSLVRDLAIDGSPAGQAFDFEGWWMRSERLEHPPCTLGTEAPTGGSVCNEIT